MKRSIIHVKPDSTQPVYNALREARSATAQQLAQATGLSVMTIGSVLARLVADGRACKGSLIPSGGGRPSQSYIFNAAYACVCVICARVRKSGPVVQVSVADLLGRILWESESLLDDVRLDSFVPLIESARLRYPQIKALGFSLPGTEHNAQLGMSASDFSSLLGARFSSFYQEWFHLPVAFENDANAAALGWSARHIAAKSLAYLYFPPGFPPGVGLILNGKLWRGVHNSAGEVGRLPLGIDWHTLADASTETLSEALARTTALACAVADPQTAVLTGAYVTPSLLQAIRQQCARYLIQPIEIYFTKHFVQDIRSGIVRAALDCLERTAPIGG